MLKVRERKCLDLRHTVEQLSEKQALLATLMESKESLQKDAPGNFHEKIFLELKELEGDCWDASTSWENC